MLDDARSTWGQVLRDHDLRVTRPRLAVLAVLDQTPHLTAEQIGDRARDLTGSLSTQAIYDVVTTLTSAGLLRRIEPAGSAMRYETRVADNHHHLICRRCGAVVDVACAHGSAPCLEVDDDHGFVVDEAEVTYWGVCADCAGAPRSVARAAHLN